MKGVLSHKNRVVSHTDNQRQIPSTMNKKQVLLILLSRQTGYGNPVSPSKEG